jgi:predicted metalloprotease with PDZ domain
MGSGRDSLVGARAVPRRGVLWAFLIMLGPCREAAAVGAPPPSTESNAAPAIAYQLDLREPKWHIVRVTMTVSEAAPETEIQFPTWYALYQIRDFVKDVQELQAQCDGRAVTLAMKDANTWRSGSQPCTQLVIRYGVHAEGAAPFSSGLDEEHAFLNLAMILFYLPRECERAIRLKFILPDSWKLATPLDEGDAAGEFKAPNYDLMADCPVEAGTFDEYDYIQKGATYRVVVHGDGSSYSSKELVETLQKITATETDLMDEVPFSRYTFIFHLGKGGGGGMEHRNGTAISSSAESVKRGGLASVAAHEFFHLWNVKRIRPQGLEPIDYVHGNDTRDLWFSEGVDSTYAELVLVRSGLIHHSDFYRSVARQIAELQERPARKFQSAEQSGGEAWLEKYPDYFRPERSISYYNKGELLGFLLDLGIRHATANKHSLDHVMLRLNQDFAHRGRFFTDDDLKSIIRGLAPEFSVDEFFRDNVSGTAELDYNAYLGYAGLRLVTQPVERSDPGFTAGAGLPGAGTVPVGESTVKVDSVEPGSSAERSGLKSGDAIEKLNGKPLAGAWALGSAKAGELISLDVRRGRRSLSFKFTVGSRESTDYSVEEVSNPSPSQMQVRNGWLGAN